MYVGRWRRWSLLSTEDTSWRLLGTVSTFAFLDKPVPNLLFAVDVLSYELNFVVPAIGALKYS